MLWSRSWRYRRMAALHANEQRPHERDAATWIKDADQALKYADARIDEAIKEVEAAKAEIKAKLALKFALLDQFGSQLNSSILIHGEQLNGCPAGRREAGNGRAVNIEVFVPGLVPGIEKPFDASGLRVDAREIRSLEGVASLACDAEVFQFIRPAVLPGDDVLDVEGDERLSRLG